MSASQWFHGSAWPPGNHGTMPDPSWMSATWSTVRDRLSAVTIVPAVPSMSRSHTARLLLALRPRRPVPDGTAGAGLGGIHDHTLPQDGVQRPLGEAGHERRLGDVPH